MQRFTHVVKNPGGFHVRQAGMIVKLAKEFSASIEIAKDTGPINANRPSALLGLKIKQGNLLIVSVEGADEKVAIIRLIGCC